MASPGSPLLSLVQIYATQTEYRSQFPYSPAFPDYAPNLTGPISFSEQLPDLFQGLGQDTQVSLGFNNVRGDINSYGARYGQNTTGGGSIFPSGYGIDPYGGPGDPTISSITAAEDLRGKRIRARLRDLDAGSNLFNQDMTITQVSKRLKSATITASTKETQKFVVTIPKQRILDVYPNADLSSSGNRDQDAPIIIPFQTMRKVPLVFLSPVSSGSLFYYGAFRKPENGSTLAINTIYRNNRVVGASEYSLVEEPPGYQVVRFWKEQRDFSGNLMQIQADVTSNEWHYPSEPLAFFLSNDTFGIGGSIAQTSFSLARTRYAALSYQVTNGMAEGRPASDVANDLLLHGARLNTQAGKAYTISVDRVQRHAPGTPQLGYSDSNWSNILEDSIEDTTRPVEERVKTLILRGLFDYGFDNNNTYLLKAQRTRNEEGTIVDVSNPYIGDSTTLDTEADYRFKRLKWADRTVTLRAQFETKDLLLEDLARLYVPTMGYNGDLLEVRGRRFNANADDDGNVTGDFEFTLAGYDESIYDYEAGTVAPAPGANVLTDYTFTPPGALQSFTLTSTSSTVAANGELETIFTVSGTTPTVNVSHIVFEALQDGSALVIVQIQLAALPNTAYSAKLSVKAGKVYDLQAYARNVANAAGSQDGPYSFVNNQTSDNAPGGLGAPSGLTVTQGTGKSINLAWTNPTNANLSHIEVHKRATSGAFSDSTLLKIVKTSGRRGTDALTLGSTYVDKDVAYGDQPYYAVRAVSDSGEKSSFAPDSNPGTRLAAPLAKISKTGDIDGHPWVSGDYTGGSVNTAARQNASSVSHSFTSISAGTQSFSTKTHSLGKIPSTAIDRTTPTDANIWLIPSVDAMTSSTFDMFVSNISGTQDGFSASLTFTVYYW